MVLDILIRAADEAVQRVKHTCIFVHARANAQRVSDGGRMGKGKAMKRSALYPLHQALGATFTTVGEWELPQHFGDPHAEYQALRHGVGLCDLSHRSLVRVTGRERQRFLHAMVSNDTQSLQPGQGCYATFQRQGHLIADFVVYAEADAYLLELEPQVARPFIEAIEYFVISEDVTFHDESGHWGLLALQGPRAAELLASLWGKRSRHCRCTPVPLASSLAMRCAVCGAAIPAS